MQCISEAMPHVYRQQGHGKHEQDRADAEAWWAKWKSVRKQCSESSNPSKKEGAIDVFGQPGES